MPKSEINGHISFYSEIIDDRVEEGLTEEAAVDVAGNVCDIISGIRADNAVAISKSRKRRRLKAFEIVLLVLGAPIWLSLLISLLGVLVSIYAVIWSVIISVWSVFVSFVGTAFGALLLGVVFVCVKNTLSGIAIIGLAAVCAGLAIFMFFLSKIATKGVIILTKKIVISIKNAFNFMEDR